jgi:RimJ/RimL family protein N-acetyltransferase
MRLAGERVTLRAFREDELERLIEVYRGVDASDGARWAPSAPDRVRDRIRGSGTWSETPTGLLLAIEAGRRLVGEIQARGRMQGLPPGVFEVGIELYEPSDRGHGIGGAAVAELARFLFRDEDANRVQLSTDVDNAVMRRVAERLGFRLEGIMRSFMPTPRGPRDYALFGMTREDYEERARTWT